MLDWVKSQISVINEGVNKYWQSAEDIYALFVFQFSKSHYFQREGVYNLGDGCGRWRVWWEGADE